jgi:hypothetical protein
MKSILDPSFAYVNAAKTDIRKTFERIRLEQKAAAAPVAATNVKPILRKRKTA